MARPVETFDLNPGGEAFVQSRVRFRPGAAWHFVQARVRLQRLLGAHRGAPVLWTTISPTPLGHLRDVAAVLPTFGRGRRVYAVVHHGSFDQVFRHPLTRVTARRALRRLSGIVFLSEVLAERCARWVPAGQRLVIPNTIDDALLCSPAEMEVKRARWTSPPTPDRPLRVLFFSHMIPEKGYLDVVRAMGVLQASGVPVRADFVGRWDSTEGRRAFEATIRQTGTASVVTYHGSVQDREEARAHYLDADVLVLPTYYPTEAQPLSVLEAMAAGTPVVVTSHASLPEMVREGREGHLVPPRDPSAIAEAIARLCQPAHWRALSEGAYSRFTSTFSPAAVGARWSQLLDEGGLP